jgi:ADP-ribose pyrophosphatase YjhB (NUDIX family)
METAEKFKKPNSIISYGIILFRIENSIPYFLLYQRRDTFEYTDFIRGIWTSENNLYILFKFMSFEERERIRKYTFAELWNDMWVHRDSKIYKDGFLKAKKKYDSVKKRIPYFLDKTETLVDGPPWGFPKGKKNGFYEDSLKCALREFSEETRIDSNKIDLFYNGAFTENFKGSNNKYYTTHYYLAETSDGYLPSKFQTNNCIRKYTLSDEASEIGWFTYDEMQNILSSKRLNIIKSILSIIDERKKDQIVENEY